MSNPYSSSHHVWMSSEKEDRLSMVLSVNLSSCFLYRFYCLVSDVAILLVSVYPSQGMSSVGYVHHSVSPARDIRFNLSVSESVMYKWPNSQA